MDSDLSISSASGKSDVWIWTCVSKWVPQRWFPQVLPLQKGEKEIRCLCRCLTNQFFMDAFRDFPVFFGPSWKILKTFFGFLQRSKSHGYEKIELPTTAMVTCRYDADIKLLVDLGILGRDSSFFCITKWHLVQVQKSKKCRKVQPQIKVHAHDRQKRDVQNLHIS